MSAHGTPIPMQSAPCGPLNGTANVPGDKSISHRSLILGALSVGESHRQLTANTSSLNIVADSPAQNVRFRRFVAGQHEAPRRSLADRLTRAAESPDIDTDDIQPLQRHSHCTLYRELYPCA